MNIIDYFLDRLNDCIDYIHERFNFEKYNIMLYIQDYDPKEESTTDSCTIDIES